jgi:hypothetical protein
MSSETIVQPKVTEVASQAYEKPAIEHELKLETRAGSPLGGDPLIDPLGIDPTAQ